MKRMTMAEFLAQPRNTPNPQPVVVVGHTTKDNVPLSNGLFSSQAQPITGTRVVITTLRESNGGFYNSKAITVETTITQHDSTVEFFVSGRNGGKPFRHNHPTYEQAMKDYNGLYHV